LLRSAFSTQEKASGNISQIRLGCPADREGSDIAAVGSRGADFLDSNGQVRKQVRFAITGNIPVAVARIDPTGAFGYLTRDESWAVPVTLFDKEGHLAWSSNAFWAAGVDDSVPGDVYGDGKLSVVVGFNGGGGIALLDGQGKTPWKKEESNVLHVETLDTNRDGREEILHSNAQGQLLVRNWTGDAIARYLPDFYVSHFAITRWGKQPSHILVPISESSEGCCNPALIVLDAIWEESHGASIAAG
jgi:hypothetical protein